MRTANRSADAEVEPFIQAFSSFRETGDNCGTEIALYDAIITIEAVDATWKITELEVIEENRIDPSAAAISTREQAQGAGSDGA